MNFAGIIWLIGVVLLVSAVVGQAIKIRGIELPALTNRSSRIALAVVGVVALLLGGALFLRHLYELNTEPHKPHPQVRHIGGANSDH